MTKKLSHPTIKIHNIETNEVIDREMNDQEFAAYQANQAAEAATETAKQAEAESKAAAKAALLTKLGITAEEAQLLLGGN
jgi:hypothetical protein